jgi:hypothetical protein
MLIVHQLRSPPAGHYIDPRERREPKRLAPGVAFGILLLLSLAAWGIVWGLVRLLVLLVTGAL